MKLSVIIPCYNVAPWLRRCLDSVRAALPADGEIIAVDDGSTDGTAEILEEVKGKGEGERWDFKVVLQENRGVSAARNRGLDAATGDWIFFVDPDDAVVPDFFTAMLEAVERESADCCICGFSEQADGAEDRRDNRLKGDYRYRTNEEIVRDYLPRIFGYSFRDVFARCRGVPLFAKREMASACRMTYRRALLEARHIRFDETIVLFEDAMFNAEYLLAASSMTAVDRPLYHIHYRPSSASGTLPNQGARYCRNKLALLRKRNALNARAGGRLAALYAASSLFSLGEILLCILRRRIAWREGWDIVKAYVGSMRGGE